MKFKKVFTSQLTAISTAIEVCFNLAPSQQLDGITIFSDCKSALQALSKGTSSPILSILAELEKLQRPQKKCVLQWIPAHVNLEFNEIADFLAKNARDLNQDATLISLADANAFAGSRLFAPSSVKKRDQITELNIDRKTATTLIRLRTRHHKNMKILADGTKKYQNCGHCPDKEHLIMLSTALQSLQAFTI